MGNSMLSDLLQKHKSELHGVYYNCAIDKDKWRTWLDATDDSSESESRSLYALCAALPNDLSTILSVDLSFDESMWNSGKQYIFTEVDRSNLLVETVAHSGAVKAISSVPTATQAMYGTSDMFRPSKQLERHGSSSASSSSTTTGAKKSKTISPGKKAGDIANMFKSSAAAPDTSSSTTTTTTATNGKHHASSAMETEEETQEASGAALYDSAAGGASSMEDIEHVPIPASVPSSHAPNPSKRVIAEDLADSDSEGEVAPTAAVEPVTFEEDPNPDGIPIPAATTSAPDVKVPVRQTKVIRRKEMVSRINERGYKVFEEQWVEVEVDMEPEEVNRLMKKQKSAHSNSHSHSNSTESGHTTKQPSAAKKQKSGGNQPSIMSFFGKKG